MFLFIACGEKPEVDIINTIQFEGKIYRLNEEEPFACIDCGTLFGVKSTIERITEKLSGHAMFSGDKLRMIQMCDNCRVNAQYHTQDNPFAGRDRPRPRTTEDYLSKRRDH